MPEVNPDAAAKRPKGIIANPNCSTMVLMMAVGPLHHAAGLRQMTATTYQAVSGSGQVGIEVLSHKIDLLGKDREVLVTGGWTDPGKGRSGSTIRDRASEQRSVDVSAAEQHAPARGLGFGLRAG